MFSMITNIYKKKTREPTLMELCTATGKLKKFFLTTRDVRCVHHGWHNAHRYDIQVLATHTRQHGCIDILHCCNDSCCARMVLSVGGSFVYFSQNARCTVTTDLIMWYSNTQNEFSPGAAIFSLQYTRHRLAAEMLTTIKNNVLRKKFLSYSFYLYRFRKYVSYGFPIINFCNPGVHYETPCIFT
jgi:hypothetical protein